MKSGEKPREKLLRIKDSKKMHTADLLSIILGHGTAKTNVHELSKKITEYLKSTQNKTVKIEELTQFEGIGTAKALQILSSLELGRRFYKNDDSKNLSSEDWDFTELSQSERQYGVHFFHHYTAKFIPQIPDKLIRRLTNGNDIVVDPFMGSGTTLVEAKLLGCHSYGFDTNPLAVKIAKAKTIGINQMKLKEIDKFLNWIDSKRKNKLQDNNFNQSDIYLFEDSHEWFRNDVAYHIKQILEETKNYSLDIQNFIEIGLSDLLKGMSNAKMDSVVPLLPDASVYIDKKHYFREVNNLTRNIPVLTRVYHQIKKMKQAILVFNKETDHKLKCQSILGDARELSNVIKHCNLVVTSPPYWSAQNYEKLHSLSFKLFNLKTQQGKEIGRNNSTYLEDMKMVFHQITKILDGYFALVIGEDNRKKQHEKLFQIAIEIGFKPFDKIIRRISNQTSRAKQIKNEFIFIFKT